MGDGWGLLAGARAHQLGWGHEGGGQRAWEKGEVHLWGLAHVGEGWGTSMGLAHMGERWGMSVGASAHGRKAGHVCGGRHAWTLLFSDSAIRFVACESVCVLFSVHACQCACLSVCVLRRVFLSVYDSTSQLMDPRSGV